jgi:hypothetical protein
VKEWRTMMDEARKRRPRVSLVAVLSAMLWIGLVAPPAAATKMLDQSFTTGYNLGAWIGDGCEFVAQTFTAGITGALTGVNIDVESIPGAPPLRVVIRTGTRGRPSGPPLAVRYLSNPQAPLSRLIAFAQPIPVVAGQQYAIQVNYRGVKSRTEAGWWKGVAGDPYPGGQMLAGNCSDQPTPFWFSSVPSDVHFRTYVEPAA